MNNTVKRTISAAVFGIVMLCGLLVNGYLFAALVIFMICVMMAEFFKITMDSDYRFSRIIAILSGVTLFLLVYLVKAHGLAAKFISLALVPVFLIMANSLMVKDKTEFFKFAYIYTGIFYIAIPLALSNLVVFRNGEFSGLLLLCFFIIIWSSDVGAYCFGITLGQKYGKKICPKISPNKSWIGFWGGYLFAIIATLIIHLHGFTQIPIIHCIILATLMHISGVVGDLFESQWKRYFNVKDSGNIMPGHGGLLDRFDSTLIAMPVGAMYLALFNLI